MGVVAVCDHVVETSAIETGVVQRSTSSVAAQIRRRLGAYGRCQVLLKARAHMKSAAQVDFFKRPGAAQPFSQA